MSVFKASRSGEPFPRSSIDSTTSAEERLKWRDHPQVTSPSFEQNNPFEDGHVLAHDSIPSTLEDEEEREKEAGDHEEFGTKNKSEGHLNKKDVERKDQSTDDMGIMQGVERESDPRRDLSWRERIRHFTWTWFCMTMATGGIANVLVAAGRSCGVS